MSSVKTQILRFTHYPSGVMYTVIVLILALLFFSLSGLAQSSDANVEFFIKSPQTDKPITVGDQLTLRLEIKHPHDSRVILPQLEQAWQDFEVVDQTAPEVVDNGDGTATTGKEIVVALFAPGEYQTPALVVAHRKADGSVEELAAPVVPIQVTSVLTEDTELRDLKAQAELPVPPVWPWILAGLWLAMMLAVLLTVAGLWLYRRWQNRPVPAELAPVPFVDTRPPEVIAHAELDRIEALDLPAQQRVKEHYILVSNCLRRYIEGRYEIPALEQTTAEVRTALREAELPMQEVRSFIGILIESDLVKFARYVPGVDEVYGLINSARAIIDDTTPEPETDIPSPEVEVAV